MASRSGCVLSVATTHPHRLRFKCVLPTQHVLLGKGGNAAGRDGDAGGAQASSLGTPLVVECSKWKTSSGRR
jgi:hypothetical protein